MVDANMARQRSPAACAFILIAAMQHPLAASEDAVREKETWPPMCSPLTPLFPKKVLDGHTRYVRIPTPTQRSPVCGDPHPVPPVAAHMAAGAISEFSRLELLIKNGHTLRILCLCSRASIWKYQGSKGRACLGRGAPPTWPVRIEMRGGPCSRCVPQLDELDGTPLDRVGFGGLLRPSPGC